MKSGAMTPRIGSLFTGYEGLGLAVTSVIGGELAWWSDIDEAACLVMAHHYPDVSNLGDITRIDWASVPSIDVLTGGFPCQDISAAGQGAGISPGTRSGLWTEMARAIHHLKPRLVVIENVRNLTAAKAAHPRHGDVEPCPWCLGGAPRDTWLRALGAVLGDLADLGLDAEWCGLPASAVGACHGRYREFIAAWPAGHPWPLDGVTADPDHLGPERGRGARRRGGGPENNLLPTPRATDHHDSMTAPASRAHVEAGNGTLPETIGYHLLPTPVASDGKRPGPAPSQNTERAPASAHSCPRRMHRWGPAPAPKRRSPRAATSSTWTTPSGFCPRLARATGRRAAQASGDLPAT